MYGIFLHNISAIFQEFKLLIKLDSTPSELFEAQHCLSVPF